MHEVAWGLLARTCSSPQTAGSCLRRRTLSWQAALKRALPLGLRLHPAERACAKACQVDVSWPARCYTSSNTGQRHALRSDKGLLLHTLPEGNQACTVHCMLQKALEMQLSDFNTAGWTRLCQSGDLSSCVMRLARKADGGCSGAGRGGMWCGPSEGRLSNMPRVVSGPCGSSGPTARNPSMMLGLLADELPPANGRISG